MAISMKLGTIIIVVLAVVAVLVLTSLAGSYVLLQSLQNSGTLFQPTPYSSGQNTVAFDCDAGKTIRAVFYPGNDTQVDLQLSDGRTMSLPHVVSADGARYANADESIVFWNKGNAAFVTEGGQATYANCVIAGPQATAPAQTMSDGVITFTYNQNFGLATTSEQILAKTSIPDCDPGFNYCIYYNADAYQGTNFDGAGLRIQKRADLNTRSKCLSTPPAGFSIVPDAVNAAAMDPASVFKNVGQGAAGHLSAGSLYRLFIPAKSLCYEFETRISQSDFGNYPPGSTRQFTSQDQQQVAVQMENILTGITLPDGSLMQLPQ